MYLLIDLVPFQLQAFMAATIVFFPPLTWDLLEKGYNTSSVKKKKKKKGIFLGGMFKVKLSQYVH